MYHDHHSHFTLYAALSNSINLSAEKDKASALKLIGGLPDDRISIVTGWNTGNYKFSDTELDAMPPVIICNLSLHGFAVSTSALPEFRKNWPEISENSGDPLWCERNMPKLLLFLIKTGKLDHKKAVSFMYKLESLGISSTEDMLLPDAESFRIIGECGLSNRISFWADASTFAALPKDIRSRIKGIKIFADGAVGTGTAALKKPYITGGNGLLLQTDDEMAQLIGNSADLSNSVAIHAIGDAATGQVIDAVSILRKKPGFTPKIRIEHAQFITPAQAVKAKKAGIVLSMQPNFSFDSEIYSDRLPRIYIENNNPFRMLIDKAGFVPGKDLIFGSDGMPHGREFAEKSALTPPMPGQILTMEELEDGYSI